MNDLLLERAGIGLGVIFAIRIVSGWRVQRRRRRDLVTPLIDPILLEAVFAPRPRDGDDADLLAEMRDTILHLNRRAYVEEFWNLHTQIIALHETLGEPQRATMHRALVRLLQTDDRWLQLVAARAGAGLGIADAIAPLRDLLQPADGVGNGADQRYRQELEKALATLTEE